MEWGQARKFLRSVFSRDDDAVALSRRDMLAGLGLAGLFLAAPKLLPGVAEAGTLAPAVEPEARSADATNSKATEQSDVEPKAASGDVTEFSAHRRRYWRRRYWRRRYWRRRYWGRRHWRRRYWRRRYWRRRYW